ncbi:hypothetical protein VitviT2T_024119 [Vitis vinifera]|uniref:Uncharacterized protein n=1 Tax=Vitis vinifera TaxID=29760 RepID=A0ABY9DH81_VITVI|nr:hypothetical protein VitviT2T_024119 [Vitis vinifera]
MGNGNLYQWLHPNKAKAKILEWPLRARIGVGLARGLAWLHHNCMFLVGHGNINLKCILLDQNFEPQISNFGGTTLMKSSITDSTWGLFVGSADTENKRVQCPLKKDVYSSGIILLEMVTGKKPHKISDASRRFDGTLVDWINHLLSTSGLYDTIDKSLIGQGFDGEIFEFLKVACSCVKASPHQRPTMLEVDKILRNTVGRHQIDDDSESWTQNECGTSNDRDEYTDILILILWESIMARPPKTRWLWTREEDYKLKRCKEEHPNEPWGEIIKESIMARPPKMRWLWTREEDYKLKRCNKEHPNEPWGEIIKRANLWAFMSKQRLLEGRSANAIKNRWYNHLKKSTTTVSNPRRPLPYHVQQPLMNDQTTDHSLSEDDIKARLSSLFTDNDIEASVPSLFTEDDIEAWVESIMARPPKTRWLWTREEDYKLKHCKEEHPNEPWGEIIKRANLQDRDEKSCSHRWNNYLKFDFNDGEFSQQEDELIINLKSGGMSWAFMSKQRLLEGRSANAIKNCWYNHLKKSTATISDSRRPLPYHVQQPLMNDQTTDHSLSEDDIKARLSSLFTDNDIEASVPYLFTEDDIEAWVSFLCSPTDDDENPISSITKHSHSFSEDDIKAWVSSLFTDNDIEAWVSFLFTDDDIEASIPSLFTDDD